MNRQEVIRRLCKLTSDVGDAVYKNTAAHDCFCLHNPRSEIDFQFEERVLGFIENAVRSGINEHLRLVEESKRWKERK